MLAIPPALTSGVHALHHYKEPANPALVTIHAAYCCVMQLESGSPCLFLQVFGTAALWGAGTAIGEIPPYAFSFKAAKAGDDNDTFDELFGIQYVTENRNVFQRIVGSMQAWMLGVIERYCWILTKPSSRPQGWDALLLNDMNCRTDTIRSYWNPPSFTHHRNIGACCSRILGASSVAVKGWICITNSGACVRLSVSEFQRLKRWPCCGLLAVKDGACLAFFVIHVLAWNSCLCFAATSASATDGRLSVYASSNFVRHPASLPSLTCPVLPAMPARLSGSSHSWRHEVQ